jgi:signal transduction histidine kinase
MSAQVAQHKLRRSLFASGTGGHAHVPIASRDSLPASSTAQGSAVAIASRDSLPASSTAQGSAVPIDHGEAGADSPSASTDDDELAQIVHDLKAPLGTISLEVEIMDSWNATGAAFDPSPSLVRIRRNVRYLDRLIHDLMDVHTLTNGHFELRRTRCDLGGLVARVIDRAVPTCDRERVKLEIHEATDTMIDVLRIERVLANLLDNALKYTPRGSDIVVGVHKHAFGVQISVSDTGPGLSPAELDSVFEPYRRGETGQLRPGTGLGLYVSKQIVEAHGGLIGARSAPGAGACFFFALPLM